MKELDESKPKQGWGQKAKKDLQDDDQFNNYQDNLQKAILKLEINEKAAKGGSNNEQILEQTLDQNETLDDRKKRLQDHKDKLIEARN